MTKKVFLGVGHGGKDPGACANGLKEEDLNLVIAKACKAELEEFGVNVLMSRETDEDDTLTDEIAECNAYAPDLAVDIHCNAGGGDGAEAFCALNGDGRTLAESILKEVKEIGQNSRGVKTKKRADGLDYFGFVRCINCPSIIFECAFVDNAKDIQIIDIATEQIAMGKAIAQGILTELKIYEKPKPEPVKSSTVYHVQVGAYSTNEDAEKMLAKLAGLGVDGFIVEVEGNTHEAETAPTEPNKGAETVAPVNPIKVGDTVRLNTGAKTYTGGNLSSYVYKRNHVVKQLNGDRAVITYNGTVVAAVNVNDLTRV